MLDFEKLLSAVRVAAGLGVILMLGFASQVKADELIIPPSLEEMVSDEVYRTIHAMPADEGWQKPQSEQKSSVRWGFDPVYEEAYVNNYSKRFAGNFDVEAPKAAKQFRLKF